MKRFRVFLCVLACWAMVAWASFAHATLAPQEVLQAAGRIDLARSTLLLEDRGGTLTLEDVMRWERPCGKEPRGAG
jgi:hypothetical protein